MDSELPRSLGEPEGPNGPEKRRHERVAYERPAELEVQPSVMAAARMLDISEGGFRVSGPVLLEPGQEFRVRYVEPVSHCIRAARAVARWTGLGPDGQAIAGFSFVASPAPAEKAIRSYVAFKQVALPERAPR